MAVPKLHELLAIKKQLEGQMTKVITDQTDTFLKKHHLYAGKIKQFQPLEENSPVVVEEQLAINSTVVKDLDWLRGHIAKAMNARHQINMANQEAVADIVLDDDEQTVVAKNLPAATLLEWEKDLAQIKTVITAIPTLDPAKSFQPDPDKGKGVYRSREIIKPRTAKKKTKITLFEPTEHQPGQAQVFDEDVVIGTIREQEWSAMLTPAQKAGLIEQCEALIRATKRARSRANDIDIDLSQRPADAVLRRLLTIPEDSGN